MLAVEKAKIAPQSPQRRIFVKDEYERLWKNTYEKAVKLLERGETNLARIHLFMRRDYGDAFADQNLQAEYTQKEARRKRFGFIYDRQLVKYFDVESRLTTKLLDAVKTQEMIQACGNDVGRIVETGAGWGKTLFNVWLHGGPRDAQYWALELTEGGTRTAELIAEKAAPDMSFHARQFDYYAPDFSMLTEDIPTLVITHHSLEQMPEISEKYFDAVMRIPGFRRCLHLEPVGFQIPSWRWLKRPRNPLLSWGIDLLNRRVCRKFKQNTNLYPLLADMERRGKIRMTTVRKHFCSTLISNATSLIVWESAGAEPSQAKAPHRRDDRW